MPDLFFGFTLMESINLCFKKSFVNSILKNFTWWKRNSNEEQQPSYNTRIQTIYGTIFLFSI